MQLHINSKQKSSSAAMHLLYLGIFAGLLLFVTHYFEHDLPAVEKWIADLGSLAPLAFVALFAVITPLFFSVDALCFAAGILFTLPASILYVGIATYLAAGIIFFIGRIILHLKLQAFFQNSQRFSHLIQAVTLEPFKLMFLLRLTPLPFALLGYAFAMAGVEFWLYIGATSAFLMQEIVVIYIGYMTKHLSALLANTSQAMHLSTPLVLIGFLLVIMIWIYVLKIVHKALQAHVVDG